MHQKHFEQLDAFISKINVVNSQPQPLDLFYLVDRVIRLNPPEHHTTFSGFYSDPIHSPVPYLCVSGYKRELEKKPISDCSLDDMQKARARWRGGEYRLAELLWIDYLYTKVFEHSMEIEDVVIHALMLIKGSSLSPSLKTKLEFGTTTQFELGEHEAIYKAAQAVYHQLCDNTTISLLTSSKGVSV